MWLPTPALEARFWAKVNKTDTCWFWTAALNQHGYGWFGISRKIGNDRAHRVSYRLCVGEIPEGLVLDHLCRVRHCVNPDHLELVTQKENLARGSGICARNSAKTHCDAGHLLEGDNLSPARLVYGHRRCKECTNLAARQYRLRVKQLSKGSEHDGS